LIALDFATDPLPLRLTHYLNLEKERARAVTRRFAPSQKTTIIYI
jgi:hypothetical protein